MQSIDAASPGNWVFPDADKKFQPDSCVNQVKWAEKSTYVVFNWWAFSATLSRANFSESIFVGQLFM